MHEIVFDSSIHNYSTTSSEFNRHIIGKKQLAFVIELDNGECFGYYLHNEIKKIYHQRTSVDFQSFHFNLLSNGRLHGPMIFEVKNEKFGGYWLYQKTKTDLISLGDIVLKKNNSNLDSYCSQNNDWFDYHGIENALCGMKQFVPKRIFVIQMK